jgi:mannose-6-phosphate isomerase-like protein (cupin superfamily)
MVSLVGHVKSPACHVEAPPEYLLLGVKMKVLLSSDQTGGQFSMIEGTMPPKGDGGLHVHLREDESMYLLDGAFEVTIGEQTFTLNSGESYFAPRGVPQRLRNLGDVPARGVLITTPGGFDRFVVEAGLPTAAASVMPQELTAEQLATFMALAEAHGIQILAAPGS